MTYSFICAACAKPFDAASPRARTCSRACRIALCRRRAAERRSATAADLVAGLRGDPRAMARGIADAFDHLGPAG